MRSPGSDTPAQIEAVLIEGFRRMTPADKLARVSAMTRAVQELALAGIRARHEGISDREARLRLASLWLGRSAMLRVFGWDEDG